MESKLFLPLVLAASLLAVCEPVRAHHGSAAYADKITEFKQVMVTKFASANPHSLIEFDAKDEKGNAVHWTCETGSPEALKVFGWNKNSIGPGDVVTVYMYAAKNGNPAGRLNKIQLADGTVLHDTVLGGHALNKSGYGAGAGGGIPGGNQDSPSK